MRNVIFEHILLPRGHDADDLLAARQVSHAKRLPSRSAIGYERRLSAARGSNNMPETTPPRLIGMSGSLRAGSYSNAVLATLREKFAGIADLVIWDLAPIPLYNQDFEGEKRPAPVKALLAAIAEADGLVLCAPEFNHSIPGVLKNALDWASRPAFTSVIAYKPVAIMATSPGALSGARCLEHIKVALDSMMARVVLARECIITSVATKIREGRLVDETSLGFACGVVEELLREIRLREMAKSIVD
jgi:chromate reductase, NAD(P)H dehydrogenase (quinone)